MPNLEYNQDSAGKSFLFSICLQPYFRYESTSSLRYRSSRITRQVTAFHYSISMPSHRCQRSLPRAWASNSVKIYDEISKAAVKHADLSQDINEICCGLSAASRVRLLRFLHVCAAKLVATRAGTCVFCTVRLYLSEA